MSRFAFLAVLVSAALATAISPISATAAPTAEISATPPHTESTISRRVIVQYRDTTRRDKLQRNAIERRIKRTAQRVKRTYARVPMVVVEANTRDIAQLNADPDVVAVFDDTPMPASDLESTPLVGASAVSATGNDGTGTAVAILDTGVDKAHPMLAGKVVAEACFSATASCPNGQTTQIGAGSAVPCTYAPNGCRHGTHVAGIAAGKRTASIPFDGVAPGANIISLQIFTRIDDATICSVTGQGAAPCALTFPSDQIAALELLGYLSLFYNVPSANMSIGGFLFDDACDDQPLKHTIDWLRTLDVATVIAAGNDSSSTSVSSPGCISTAVTVGATTKADGFAAFSNSNPVVDIVAPGVSINSSIPGGGTAFFNGTSMATPHVAGAFTLARQQYPHESIDQIQTRLVNTGPVLTDARNGLSFHRLDILAALRSPELTPTYSISNDSNVSTVVTIPVQLSTASALPVTVRATPVSVTAMNGQDFAAAPATITFAPGQTVAHYSFTVNHDSAIEGVEYALVAFNAPSNAVVGGFFGLGIVVIDD